MGKGYSIYEAKARFSELLRIVKGGNEVTVTERGEPIAKVIPFRRNDTLDEKIEHLKNCGHLLSSSQRGKMVFTGAEVPGGLQRFLKERE